MASRFVALDCFRSSDALPNENARRKRDFPGLFEDSFLSSVRRLAAGESDGGEEAMFSLLSVSCSVIGESGFVDAGWDNGEGLATRFSSGLPFLLLTELVSGDDSRTCSKHRSDFKFFCSRFIFFLSWFI
jgi:hypothetical protein